MTDLSLEEEDEEVEKIEGCNHCEWKNSLLPILWLGREDVHDDTGVPSTYQQQ